MSNKNANTDTNKYEHLLKGLCFFGMKRGPRGLFLLFMTLAIRGLMAAGPMMV